MRLKVSYDLPTTAKINIRVDQSLDDGHASLGELLLGITAGGVGNVDSVADVDVVDKGDVLDLNAAGSVQSLQFQSLHAISSYRPLLAHSIHRPSSVVPVPLSRSLVS